MTSNSNLNSALNSSSSSVQAFENFSWSTECESSALPSGSVLSITCECDAAYLEKKREASAHLSSQAVYAASEKMLQLLGEAWPEHPVLSDEYENIRWEWDIVLTDNQRIQALNEQHRNKSSATDVLSFPGLEFQKNKTNDALSVFPIQNLGSVVISLEWANEYAAQCERSSQQPSTSEQVRYFILDRLMHGLLHILGQHHDTMPDYKRVVEWQTQAVLAAFELPQNCESGGSDES